MQQPPPESASPFTLLIFLLFVIPFVFYLIMLQKTLKTISPENRKMKPPQVWLMFIPLFGLVWHFIMVAKIADSIKAESLVRDMELKESRPGYSVGLAMCILNCTSLLSGLSEIMALLSVVGFIICWIVYWVKIASYRKQIVNSGFITLDAETFASNVG